ncbi:MAG: hypothetical protein EBV06_12635 [Planctomycetia bacterium]|nr:hypothetical protein [Planctomycetia bacterium]
MTKKSDEIDVLKFNHILQWPMLLGRRGKAKSDSDKFAEVIKATGWNEQYKPLNYAEFVYFHPFVRDFLFGKAKETQTIRAIKRFIREDIKTVQVQYGFSKSDNNQKTTIYEVGPEITLAVKRMEVLLIAERVLMLVVEVSNEDLSMQRFTLKLDQVLRLQNSLRQVFPPYFNEQGHQGDTLASLKWSSIAPSLVRFQLNKGPENFQEWVREENEPPMFDHWQVLFGDRIRLHAARTPSELSLEQIIDNRIPAMSFIVVEDPNEISQDDLDRLPAFDPPGLDYAPQFRDRHRERFRYDRFAHLGTIYYCNGTSFAILCGESVPNYLLMHFQCHYANFGLLAHYQHAALLHFKDELTTLSADLNQSTTNPKWQQDARTLLIDLLEFRTRSYFTEVSNQIQGRDLFALYTGHLETAQLFAEVTNTADHIYEMLEDQVGRDGTAAQTKLANAAQLGLSITIGVGVASAILTSGQLFPKPESATFCWEWLIFAGTLFLALLLGGLSGYIFDCWTKNKLGEQKQV